jgi:hypothetical protein
MAKKEYDLYRIYVGKDLLHIYLTETVSFYTTHGWLKNGLVKIEIRNPDCSSSNKELMYEIDPHGEPIVFEITKNANGKCLKIGDEDEALAKYINGSEIIAVKVAFSLEDLGNEIEFYREKISDLEKERDYLRRHIAGIAKVADKEIGRTDVVLKQLSDKEDRKYLKWNLVNQIWRDVKQMLPK